jgi:oxygen-independent coproporphyrinogen-3 oxidase
MLDAKELPVERGYDLSLDDRIRRTVITELMCNFHLDRSEIERAYGIDFKRYFEKELAELRGRGGPVEHGFLRIDGDSLEVVGNGSLFVRNICMTFDRYLRGEGTGEPAFSRTI